MTTIYHLRQSKSLVMCDQCLDDHGPVPGKWDEEPLKECSICGAVDADTREEYANWALEMDNQQWEEDQRMWEDHIAPDTHNHRS